MVLHDHCGGDASVRLCRVCVCVDIVPDLCITTCDLVGSSGSMLGVSHWSHPLMFGARVQLLSSLCKDEILYWHTFPSPDLKNLAVQISDTFTERSSTKNTARTLKIDSSPLRPCGLVTVWQDARSARDAAPVRAGTGVCRVVCVGHLVAVSFDCTPSHGPCRDRPAEDRASGGDARVICDPNSRTGSAGSHTTTLCVAPPGTDQHSSARGHTMCMAPSVRACAMWA